MPDMAQITVPFLPARWLVRYRFDNLAKLPTLRCSIFQGHGTHDEIVPFAMSQRLAAVAAPGSLTRLEIDSGHNDLFDAGGPEIWPALEKWLVAKGIVK
jgi:pimeloyl-ACP methyl ester carboxylesterase